jgi:sugar phosphate isomerase/epimerase
LFWLHHCGFASSIRLDVRQFLVFQKSFLFLTKKRMCFYRWRNTLPLKSPDMKTIHPLWLMSSAYPSLQTDELIARCVQLGLQGIQFCVFRRDGQRKDHIATHLPYEDFDLHQAKILLNKCQQAGLQLSLGAFENLIGGDIRQQRANQNHLLRLIRMAYLLGGDRNQVKVGTFVGYDHELGQQEKGFYANLLKYKEIFTPIIHYAEDLGVTVLYENCPMEGWRSSTFSQTFNNLTGVLAARQLMYTLIPSKAHGEIYDPSHDIWQHTDPLEVIRLSDMSRIHRIHVKATRLRLDKARIQWGGMYPMQWVDPHLASQAGIAIPAHDWDRHHYEAMLPGFGGPDGLDWRAFVQLLKERGFVGAYEIENEARNSKDTGSLAAIDQGFKTTVAYLAPLLWPLDYEKGYVYRGTTLLGEAADKDIPVKTMDDL